MLINCVQDFIFSNFSACFCESGICGYVVVVYIRGGVEDTRLEAKDTKKNSRPRPRTAFPRTDTLEAKDRNVRGQGQGPRTLAQAFFKKKNSKNFFQAISKRGKQKRSSQIFREVFGVFLHNLKNEQIHTIVGADANAHHTIWRSSDINLRGEDLLAYCVSAK